MSSILTHYEKSELPEGLAEEVIELEKRITELESEVSDLQDSGDDLYRDLRAKQREIEELTEEAEANNMAHYADSFGVRGCVYDLLADTCAAAEAKYGMGSHEVKTLEGIANLFR